MNWEAIGAVGEAVGAIGVIASLVYVGLQVRQNTRSLRAATSEALLRSVGDATRHMIQDRDLAKRLESALADWSSVDADDRAQINYLFVHLFRMWENAFFQMEAGTLDPTLWEAWRNVMLSYFHQPGVQTWWPARRSAFSSRFRDFLEQSAAPGEAIRTWEQLGANDSLRDVRQTGAT